MTYTLVAPLLVYEPPGTTAHAGYMTALGVRLARVRRAAGSDGDSPIWEAPGLGLSGEWSALGRDLLGIAAILFSLPDGQRMENVHGAQITVSRAGTWRWRVHDDHGPGRPLTLVDTMEAIEQARVAPTAVH